MWKYVEYLTVAIAIIFCWSISQTKARSSNEIVASRYLTQLTNVATQQQQPIQQQQSQHQQQQQQQQQQQEHHANNISANNENNITDSSNIWQDISMVYRLYQQCTGDNLSICLKVKLLTHLENMLRSVKMLKLIDGVQFIKSDNDNSLSNSHQSKTKHKATLNEKDIEAILPRSFEAKEETLNNLIFMRLSSFLRDHTLQIKFPNLNTLSTDQNQHFEGRKKDKKGGGGGGAYMMIPLLLGGTVVPIAYGALALLAGKALIVSKLALVLSMIIGIKKLLSGGGKESHEVVVSSGGHSGWGRNIDVAYGGWKSHKEKAL